MAFCPAKPFPLNRAARAFALQELSSAGQKSFLSRICWGEFYGYLISEGNKIPSQSFTLYGSHESG